MEVDSLKKENYYTYFYYVIKLYVHVCVLERAKHSFFVLPNPLSCSVMNKICLNQRRRIIVMELASFKEGQWSLQRWSLLE